jgi:prolyl oligopeptidase
LTRAKGQAEKIVENFIYPPTRRDESAGDLLHGTFVPDPYRWLEDDNSDETGEWVSRQNALTQAYLEKIPFRKQLAARYEELFNFPKISSPMRVGQWFFSYRNSGLQNQSVIYVRQGLHGPDQVFIDPNEIDPSGTTSISLMGASHDDRFMAVSVQKAGSDWQDITVWDLTTMTELPDLLNWTKFSGAAWYQDGFFYSRYPTPEPGTEFSAACQWQKVYYHKVGQAQAQDVLIYGDDSNPNLYLGVGVTEDEEYATLYITTGTDGYEEYFHDLRQHGMPTRGTQWVPLQQGFEYKTSLIDVNPNNGQLLVMTNVDAPNYRLVSVDPTNPIASAWKDILPTQSALLQGVSVGGGRLFAHYLQDVTTRIRSYDLDGQNETEIELPDLGSAGGFGAKRGETYSFYSFSSFTDPGTIYQYDYATGVSELYHRPELKLDPSEFTTEQVFYPSKDGTRVPMFIVHRKGLARTGANPTMLYAYGGFNASLSPNFSTSRMLLLEQGGVFALANLRGGGEYGEEWHKAGMKENKQNVFDDFVAAAEYLIEQKWTDSPHLGINGGSNGGLLVGAVMTQRPELFGVCIPEVGVMDMLRYQKFTAGFGWIPEYGSAENSPAEFEFLRQYSPLHNLKPAPYPATLVMTADHDDRVVPAHSFKFISTLQPAQRGEAPTLIRIETQAGHGAGKPTSKIIEEQADKWAFFFHSVGHTPTFGG